MSGPCPFGSVGCNLNAASEVDREKHLHEKTTEHQLLMLSALKREKDRSARLEERSARLEERSARLEKTAILDELWGMKHEALFVGMDRRLQTDYGVCCNWIVEDIRGKVEAVKRRKNEVILSEQFSSHHGGYQLQLRCHPDGQGSGRCTHLCLYLYVVASPGDAGLAWPLALTTTARLLDTTGRGQHKVLTVVPGQEQDGVKQYNVSRPDSDYYMDHKLAWNCDKFLPYDEIIKKDNSIFVKNNTIYIRLSIEK